MTTVLGFDKQTGELRQRQRLEPMEHDSKKKNSDGFYHHTNKSTAWFIKHYQRLILKLM
jgi:hypothetical protein